MSLAAMTETAYQKQEKGSLYQFKQTQDQRWGIYLEDRLLATVGSYAACQSIGQHLTSNLSREDLIRATIAFKNSINKS
ncbi:MAG: hypothetical protein ACFCAD_13570 [Pleurocapsa sp.]